MESCHCFDACLQEATTLCQLAHAPQSLTTSALFHDAQGQLLLQTNGVRDQPALFTIERTPVSQLNALKTIISTSILHILTECWLCGLQVAKICCQTHVT